MPLQRIAPARLSPNAAGSRIVGGRMICACWSGTERPVLQRLIRGDSLLIALARHANATQSRS
jgi:hypothetical protein